MHHHPICHYLRGERLYYLLITVETSAEVASAHVDKALANAQLQDRACAYWLFGDTDIIVRVWASESKIMDLEADIRKAFVRMEHPVRRLLVSSMLTWYQRSIEARGEWHTCLRPDNALNMIDDAPPRELLYECGPSDSRKVMRYFIFIREPSAKNKKLFSALRESVEAGGSFLSASESRVSLYSVYSRDFNGVVLKGETSDFSKAAQDLVEFASDQKKQGRETTTYICSRNLRSEGNNLATVQDSDTETMRYAITENLLLSEECSSALWRTDVETVNNARKAVSSLFINNLCKELPYVFSYHDEWWPYVKDLRYLYKWVLFADNEQLMAFLARHYAICENELRKLLQAPWRLQQDKNRTVKEDAANSKLATFLLRKVIEKWALVHDGPLRAGILSCFSANQKILSDCIKAGVEKLGENVPADIISGIRGCLYSDESAPSDEQNMTMGSMASYLETSVAAQIEDATEKDLVNEFAIRLRDCGRDRNRVVHGAIDDFFKKITVAGRREVAWQSPVVSFIRMRLLFPHVVSILQEWKSIQVSLSSSDES